MSLALSLHENTTYVAKFYIRTLIYLINFILIHQRNTFKEHFYLSNGYFDFFFLNHFQTILKSITIT